MNIKNFKKFAKKPCNFQYVSYWIISACKGQTAVLQ